MSTPTRIDVAIPAGGVDLSGQLDVPAGAIALVVFSHGSGSSRLSPRNQHVAAALRQRGFATLLLDLLTELEARCDGLDATLRFDVDLLADRLIAATDWVRAQPELAGLPIAYFGASTGAATALLAAARRPLDVAAVVSRGGRPDLAQAALADVRSPTLFIVGGADRHLLALNRAAVRQMTAPAKLTIIVDATHLFEEPGALDEVARLAGDFLIANVALPRTGWRAPGPSSERRS